MRVVLKAPQFISFIIRICLIKVVGLRVPLRVPVRAPTKAIIIIVIIVITVCYRYIVNVSSWLMKVFGFC